MQPFTNDAGNILFLQKWLKKRDFLAYYFLWKTYRTNEFNLGEALNLLHTTFCYSKKTAANIIKRLYKLGLLQRINYMVFKCLDLDTVLQAYLRSYIKCRGKACKSKEC